MQYTETEFELRPLIVNAEDDDLDQDDDDADDDDDLDDDDLDESADELTDGDEAL